METVGETPSTCSLRAEHILRRLGIIYDVVPAVATDVKIFVGIYQKLSNLGPTLGVQFPSTLETAVASMASFVSQAFPVFLPLHGACLTGRGVYM